MLIVEETDTPAEAPSDGPFDGPADRPVDTPSRSGRAMGLDLGTRRTGIAVTDSGGTMALPRTTLERSRDPESDRRKVIDLVLDEDVRTLVIGLPISLDGSEGPAAAAAREEAAALRDLLADRGAQVDVELFDERLTTVSADRALAAGGLAGPERRRVVDQSAAAIMLSAWLEAGRRQTS